MQDQPQAVEQKTKISERCEQPCLFLVPRDTHRWFLFFCRLLRLFIAS